MTMESKHTPGPWYKNGYYFQRDQADPTGRRVILCGGDSGLCEGYTINSANTEVCHIRAHRRHADASLIAAAPDLLQLAISVACHFAATDAPLGAAARSAIAKARGE